MRSDLKTIAEINMHHSPEMNKSIRETNSKSKIIWNLFNKLIFVNILLQQNEVKRLKNQYIYLMAKNDIS